jgi:hypothetical protein
MNIAPKEAWDLTFARGGMSKVADALVGVDIVSINEKSATVNELDTLYFHGSR